MKRRWRLGDRPDGYKLRKVDPFFRLIPHVMTRRSDAQVFYEERVYLDKPQKLIRELRKEGYRVGLLHVVLAAAVRAFSQKPKANRFISGKKAYARKEIVISLAVKKAMTEQAEETVIKLKFDPTDDLYDVIEKVNSEVEKSKVLEEQNQSDKYAKLFNLLPNFLLGGAARLVKVLDHFGILPKSVIDASPMHCSIFVTDLGSLGIRSVHHHIYDFGTTSLFLSFGTRTREQVVEPDGTVTNRKAMDFKLVVDERIVDGFYFAGALKALFRNIGDPEKLLTKPEQVIYDDEI